MKTSPAGQPCADDAGRTMAQTAPLVTSAPRDEQQWRSFLDTVDDMVYFQTLDGQMTMLNEAHVRLTGYTREEFAAEPDLLCRIMHPDDKREGNVFFAQHPAGAATHESVYRLRHKRGEWRWIQTRMVGMKDAADAYVGYTCIDRDITASVQAEERSRVLAELLDVSPAAVTVHDFDGTFLFANKHALALHGYTLDEFLALNLHQVDVPESAALIAPRLAQMRAEGELSFEVAHRHRDGSTIPLLVNARIARWGERDVVLSVATDISERKRTEEQRLAMERHLQQAQKFESIGVLAGGIAHDFNNLLMAMLGNLDLAQAQLGPDAPARANLDHAVHAAMRAADLTRQMLAYAGKGQCKMVPVNVNALIEANNHMLRAAVAKSLEFRIQLAASVPPVQADPGQVQQVIMNLITNASEAIGEQPGVVALASGCDQYDAVALQRSCLEEKPEPGAFVWFEVADNGCGMDDATLERLFDPFFTTKFTGRGLGMPAVMGIVRAHHGAIFVDSNVGVGTTVRVLLPALAPPAVAPVSAPAPAPPRPAPGAVLVIDDEPAVCSVCAAMITHAGYPTYTATSGADGVRLFCDHLAEIVCVVLDLTMPGMDGVATFEALRKVTPTVRVILSSGYTMEQALERCAGMALAGFVQKPYHMATLRAELDRALAAPAP
jgi:PAS domain S-box-containing protein